MSLASQISALATRIGQEIKVVRGQVNGVAVTTTPAIGNVLTATGTAAATWQTPAGGGPPVTDVQVFTASGTWTKPVGAKSVNVTCIGAGGGGGGGQTGSSGGGGGSFSHQTFVAIACGETESVTIALGALGGGTGGNAGVTTFGSLLNAGGGAGGAYSGGCGGGTFSSSAPSLVINPYADLRDVVAGMGALGGWSAEYGGGGGGRAGFGGGGSIYGAGGGGGGVSGGVGPTGGANHSYGIGGGGAGSASTDIAAVTPVSRSGSGRANHGGGGGSSSTSPGKAANGGIPGGGGGGSYYNIGANGGRGEVIVTTYF